MNINTSPDQIIRSSAQVTPGYMSGFGNSFETEALPAQRVVVRFRFTDVAPSLPRVTWLILDRDDVDVCYRDPGFEVDLVVSGALRALIPMLHDDRHFAPDMAAAEDMVRDGTLLDAVGVDLPGVVA